jgi:ABC-type transport system substrate-binding protein
MEAKARAPAHPIGQGERRRPVTFGRQECRGVGTYPKTEAFNAGQAAIGTGPYKLVRYVKGDRVILERNEGYWGEKPVWQRVIFRPITSAGPEGANPALDALIDKALQAITDEQRGEILAEACRLVMADYGAIPPHFEMTTWGFRQGLDYKPRADQYTLATKVMKAK